MGLAVLLLATGCSSKIEDATFVPGLIPGTGTVTFSTKKDGEVFVRFGIEGEELSVESPRVAASSGVVPIYGLPSGKSVQMEVVLLDGDKERVESIDLFTVAQPDEQVPPIKTNVWNPDLACDPGGYVLFSFIGASKSGVAIIDRESNYVWSYGSPDPLQQIARVRPSRDGQSLLWNYADISKVEDIAHIVRMSADGETTTETRTLSAHHDFVELPDGGFGFLAYEFRDLFAPSTDTGPVVTNPADLGAIFGAHPWQAAGADLSAYASAEGQQSVQVVLDAGSYSMTVANGDGSTVESSGTFELDTATTPWGITMTQSTPEAATLQGIIEVHTTMLQLEIAQVSPDLGLTPPTPDDGFGSTAGPGYNEGDNVLTFRRQVSVAADAIYEVAEGASETGAETVVWSAFEDYPQGVYRLPAEGFAGAFLPDAFELGHGNSLAYVDSTNTYYMGWRWLDTLLAVERGGALQWQWGGPFNELTGDDSKLFYHSHFSDVWDGGLLMFDNRTRELNSRLVEYSFDGSSFEQTWEYMEPEPKFENLLGDVQRIPVEGCDNVLVSWSGQGRISEITRDGQVVWDTGATAIGNVISRVYFLPDLYDMSGAAYKP